MPKNSDPFEGNEEPELDISPLIDVAFLLLIYFIVTTTLSKQEADLSLTLPGIDSTDQREVKIDQMLIRIEPGGEIMVNEEIMDTDPLDRTLPNLTERLERYAASTQVANTEPQIIIDCADEARGQRFVDVLNTCAKANIRNVSLAQ